ncbi:MAG: DUF2079 domain-containing protein [Microcoleaceae cyanobacterium]
MATFPESSDVQKPSTSTPAVLKWMILSALAIFLVCSSLRHEMFQSTAYDLGIYDQVSYLISQGEAPISSILGFHHLGNHGAWAVYPLGLLYKIYPSVYWLLIIQAIALSMGGGLSWRLARFIGLNERLSIAMAAIYLLYPVVFNLNLFDFHPEVMALPALLGAILAAKRQQILWFCAAIVWVLGCKAVLSLTVLALGFWLFMFEKRRNLGLIAIALGIGWFIIVTQWMIPQFSGREVEGVWRYSYLGTSVGEILKNFILKPHLVLGRLVSGSTLDYLFKLILPVIFWLSPHALIALIPAIPTLIINSLSDIPFQRSLAYQYSLPVIPFLLLAVIDSLKSEEWILWRTIKQLWYKIPHIGYPPTTTGSIAPLPTAKLIIVWSLLIFLVYGKYGRFGTYIQRLDTWAATREAIAQIQPETTVLTDNQLAPHLTHRQTIKLFSQISPETNLSDFEQIILNLRYPWPDTAETSLELFQQLSINSQFFIAYQQDDVIVFNRNLLLSPEIKS